MTQTASLSRTAGAAPWELTAGEARGVADLLDAIGTVEKMKSAMDAFLAFAYAEVQEVASGQAARARVDTADEDFAYRSMAAEVAVATNVSQNAAAKKLAASSVLVDRFPLTRQALRDGVIGEGHAKAIADVGMRLSSQEVRARFEGLVLEHAATETVFHTRRIAKVIAAKLEPADVEERCERAVRQRRVWVEDLEDGMAELGAILPVELAHGVFNRVRDIAGGVRRAARAEERVVEKASGTCPERDERTIRQIGADVFADLLLTGTPAGHAAHTPCGGLLGEVRAMVQVTIPVETLTAGGDAGAGTGTGTGAGAGRQVAFLESGAVIHPDRARRLAKGAATWERIFIRPGTGDVVATDAYRPTVQQRRAIQVRDQACRFPGCQTPASRCDIDHTIDHAYGGATSTGNLGALCRGHHTLKHQAPWQVSQSSRGVYEWTSPAGRRSRTEPRSRVRFQEIPASPDPPPSSRRRRDTTGGWPLGEPAPQHETGF